MQTPFLATSSKILGYVAIASAYAVTLACSKPRAPLPKASASVSASSAPVSSAEVGLTSELGQLIELSKSTLSRDESARV